LTSTPGYLATPSAQTPCHPFSQRARARIHVLPGSLHAGYSGAVCPGPAQALLLHGTVRVVLVPSTHPSSGTARSFQRTLLNPPDGLRVVPSTWGGLQHPRHRAPSSMRSLYLNRGLRRAVFGCRSPTGARSDASYLVVRACVIPVGIAPQVSRVRPFRAWAVWQGAPSSGLRRLGHVRPSVGHPPFIPPRCQGTECRRR
jgi:hypothetical protein